MKYKDIKELSFKVSITDYENLLNNEYGDEYEWYKVQLKDCMKLSTKDRENLMRELKDSSSVRFSEDLHDERIEIFDGESKIGYVELYLSNKIKSKQEFISLSEAKSGDAGACACFIVDNKLFRSFVYNRRYAYIEWINLYNEYKTEKNEGLVLKKILEFIKINYNVKRVFSKPVAINLSDDEVKIMRVDYHQIETNYYLKYSDYMVGYVRSYYADAHSNKEFLSKLSKEKYSEIYNSYEKKKLAIQKSYKENGMDLISDEFEGIMCANL